MRKRILAPLSGMAAAILLAAAAHGQSLEDRIARVDGTARFSYQPKPGVCGDGGATIYIQESGNRGRRITIRGDSWNTTTSSKYMDEWSMNCEPGPVRVALTVEDGTVSSLRSYVGGQWRPRDGATDLGEVPSRVAADYLLSLAERSSKRVGSDAMFAATLADVSDAWRRLLRIARNQDINREVRRNAVFWLGQEAADAATVGLKEIIDSDEDLEVRKHAIFSLSQRPNDESVPALIAYIRREGGDPRLKQQALFWLGQKDDPRALAVFEEILTRR
jgi:hypothetical protein